MRRRKLHGGSPETVFKPDHSLQLGRIDITPLRKVPACPWTHTHMILLALCETKEDIGTLPARCLHPVWLIYSRLRWFLVMFNVFRLHYYYYYYYSWARVVHVVFVRDVKRERDKLSKKEPEQGQTTAMLDALGLKVIQALGSFVVDLSYRIRLRGMLGVLSEGHVWLQLTIGGNV